jgi:hypothetical protein
MGRQIAIVFVVLLFFGAALNLYLGRQKAVSNANATPSPSTTTGATATPKSTPTPKPTPRPTYVPTPPPPTVTVSGWGSGNSRVFRLGDNQGYTYRYNLPGRCQYYAMLVATDGSYTNGDFIGDVGPTSGARTLPVPLSGTFYISMSTGGGCAWSVTFTPL